MDPLTTAVATFSIPNVGTNIPVTVSGASLVGAQANNYALIQQPIVIGTITRRALSITAQANTKIYDGTAGAATVPTVSGLVGADSVTGLAEVYSDLNTGSNKTLSVSAYTINDGNNGNNYTVTKLTNTTGVINKATLTITATTNTKTYDSTLNAAALPTVSGLIGNDSVTGLSELYDTANTGSGKTLSVNTIAPISATLTGLNGPVALAFDSSGNLYVANRYSDTVSKFAPGATTPSATLTGLNVPLALVIDGSGNLYVANGGNGTVSKFAPGATTASVTLTGLNGPVALAFDSRGNLYVANQTTNGTVSVFAPGGTTPSATLTGLYNPEYLIFDSSGNLYVSNLNGTVSKFAPGSNTPSATLTGLSEPLAMAFDKSGNLYVANFHAMNGDVSVFAPGGTTPSATLTGLIAPRALAFDSSGNLYVANYSPTNATLSKFTPGATTPSATLSVLSLPEALSFDSSGNLCVANLGINTVNKIAPAAQIDNFVPAYTVIDGNSGNNYRVTLVNDTTGTIVPGPFSKFVDTLIGGNTVVAGASFLFIVQASDQYGNAVSTYNGPASVTTSISPIDPLGNLPVSGSLQNTSAGFGFFLGNLQTAGTYTLTTSGGGFSGSSSPITVIPAGASYFTVAAPIAAITGNSFNVTVTAHDQYGNVETDYTGTVQLAGAAALGSPYTFTTGAGKDNGVHTFSVTLNTGGSQKISATDITSTNPTITGTSSPIAVSGLTVTAFTPTPTGFTASFSKAFIPNDLILYGTNKNTVQDVTLVGTHVGPIHGSLIIDPSNMKVTFKATASYLLELNGLAQSATVSAVLPDDTYKVVLVSGLGANGFLDALGAHLDGTNNGGHANFTTSFTTQYHASATPVLGIPDFARGPDSNTPIKVPNDSANGIPLTLYNAANVTDVTFSLTYNPSLLNITGTLSGLASDATDAAATLSLVSNVGGVATFHYTDANPQSASPSKPLVLGDIVAVVPSGAGAPALILYQTKELLQLGSIVINQGTITGAMSANGVHVNAYFGDVTGDKVIDGLDKLSADNVSQGRAAGFSAYVQLDPVLIGDVAGDLSIDAGDVAALDSFVAQLHPAQIPQPPTQLLAANPNYVNPSSIHSPNAADPTLSLVTRGLTALGSPVVSVMIDHPDPEGSTGLTSVTLALTYDPALLSVSAADITLGSLPGGGTGWQLSAVVDQSTGQIGIQLYSLTPFTVNQAGSLVNIAFHLIVAPTGVSPQALPTVQLVDAVTPNGQWFGTGVADSQGALILSSGVDPTLVW